MNQTHPGAFCLCYAQTKRHPSKEGNGNSFERSANQPTKESKMYGKRLKDDVVDFARKLVDYHITNLMDNIFKDIKEDKELTKDYDKFMEKRIGRKGIPKFKDLEEAHEEIRMGIMYVFMLGGISHNWPGKGKK
jgi:hypothetical protein